VTEGAVVATWWRRAAARLVDVALLSPPIWWVRWQVANLPDLGLGGVAVVMALFAVAAGWLVFGWMAYDVLGVRLFGATAGKAVLGIEVRTVAGARPSWGQAAARALGSTLPVAVLGLGAFARGEVAPWPGLLLAGWWLWRIGRGDGRAGYDRRAGTVVVPRGVAPAQVADAALAAGHPAPLRFFGRVALSLVVAVALVTAVSWVLRMDDAPGRVGDRLAAALQADGFTPLPPGRRGEHCHLGWDAADCPAAQDGRELRRRGDLADGVAAVITAARGLGRDAEELQDPYSSVPGHAVVVVRSGRTVMVVTVTTAAWKSSTVPPGYVAVWWSER
jgi:hypothetical protein